VDSRESSRGSINAASESRVGEITSHRMTAEKPDVLRDNLYESDEGSTNKAVLLFGCLNPEI